MARPYGLLRAGYPYLATLGMRRVTNFPTDIAFGPNGILYILLRIEGAPVVRVWSIDDSEEFTDNLISIGHYGAGDGGLVWPVNIITNEDGDIFVTDEALHRITRFNKDGEFVGKFGTHGDAPGKLQGPTGIALDLNGNLLIVDSKNHRIQRYTKEGKYLGGFGSYGRGYGELNLPWGIEVDDRGSIYVVDWGNNRVQIFSDDGSIESSFGEQGSGEGQFDRPTGIAVDAHGDIYVADWGNNRVLMYNSERQYIWSFAGDATLSKVARNYMLTNALSNRLRETARLEQERYLRRPRSVRVDSDFRLFIPDFESYRVQIYQKDFVPLDESQMAAPLRNPTLTVA